MRTPLNCAYCGTQIGWHITYPNGPHGQDPPENEIFEHNEGCDSPTGEPLCVECYDEELENDEELKDGENFELEEEEDSE